MDEPTNDLDVETLEILEDLLLEYDGTLLLVSHDRAFLNNIVTSTLAMDGAGRVVETVGGYDDWQRQNESAKPEPKARKATVGEAQPAPESTSKKLSYKEQRALESQKKELAELPQRIEKLEADIHALTVEMANPLFYQQDSAEIARVVNQLKEMQDELAGAYHRWEELEKQGL
jgi:ATP-binding cassette subfamily F protein uup